MGLAIIVLAALVGLFINEYPWIILVAIIVLVVGIIIYNILDAKWGHGGYSGSSSSQSGSSSTSFTGSQPPNTKDLSSDQKSVEGELRKRDAWSPTAVYRDGQVFDGFDPWNVIRATYTNGYVYEGTTTGMLGRIIGRYQNGNIYKGEIVSDDNLVGTYSGGRIYKGNRQSMTAEIATYTGDPSGAAAAAIYYLF